MKRVGSVIEIKEDCIEEYKYLHANQWPEITKILRDFSLHNYSIYLRKLPDNKYYLFSYFEYMGSNFEEDMEKMANEPKIIEWWAICKPMHIPLKDKDPHEWWAEMEKVFHQD